jgi:hypothetical protein
MSEREREALNQALWAWYERCKIRYVPTIAQAIEQLHAHAYELSGRDNAN